jgi:dephospho-CoA kinase
MITDDGARKPDNSEGLKNKGILIGVVGVCASGKSTLVKGLEARGYRTRHIAQEHSYVTNPDLLIYLDVSYPTTIQRRNLNWTEADYAEEQRRLLHAREHADLYVNTDPLSIEEVLEQVIRFIMTFHR